MYLWAHHKAQIFCQRQRGFDYLPPILHRLQRAVDDRHFCAQNTESQPVGKPQVPLQKFHRFLRGQVSVL